MARKLAVLSFAGKALCAASIAACSAPSSARDASTYKVTVDGTTYRVGVTGNSVQVASKAFVVGQTIDERARMRRAVSLATGCSITDDMFYGNNHLHGTLSCAPKATAAE